MQNKHDQELIRELRLGKLSPEQQAAHLAQFYETLDIKVGMALEAALSEEQNKQFETVAGKGNDETTMEWLRQALPNYEQIIEREFGELKRDIRENSEQFKNL